jgi:hypothetical protein
MLNFPHCPVTQGHAGQKDQCGNQDFLRIYAKHPM